MELNIMSRKLATVQKIESIIPHDNADSLEIAKIRGWTVVVKKGEFKAKDLCIFIEIDSFLPIIPQFNFLIIGTSPKKMIFEGKEIEGIRLKTKKLRGQLSQGLALPLNTFSQIPPEIEFDGSELLNIIKYEPPIPACLSGEVVGNFPGSIPKTDENRIQSLTKVITDFMGKTYSYSEKLDGSSATLFKQGELGVCSHNLQLKEKEGNTFWRIANQYNLKEKLPDGFAIQAELVGEGIQSNRLKLKGQDIYVFYVFDINKAEYLPTDEIVAFAKEFGLKTVPIIGTDFEFTSQTTSEKLVLMADGPSALNPNCIREGLVFRQNGNRQKISFKIISNEYLLKYGI
jgi:RNA ligase (TIGR02306 family)